MWLGMECRFAVCYLGKRRSVERDEFVLTYVGEGKGVEC